MKAQFFAFYLTSYLFWLGISAGSLAMLLTHRLTGGRWGERAKPYLNAAAGTMPLMALLFLPVVLGLHDLYHWTHAEAAHDPVLAMKRPYLNVPFFLGRAAFYFATWIALAHFVPRGRWKGGPGLLLYGLTMTFAAFDWGMSLEPHWFSTIYGVLVIIGQCLSALAFTIVACRIVERPEGGDDFHDFGNLLLALVMLWAYMSFSQFLIIWSGDIQEEIPWYVVRSRGGWQIWISVVAALGFFAPFFLLLLRPTKRKADALAGVAALVLVTRFLDLNWLVHPAFHRSVGETFWPWALLVAAIGAPWLWAFRRGLDRGRRA